MHVLAGAACKPITRIAAATFPAASAKGYIGHAPLAACFLSFPPPVHTEANSGEEKSIVQNFTVPAAPSDYLLHAGSWRSD